MSALRYSILFFILSRPPFIFFEIIPLFPLFSPLVLCAFIPWIAPLRPSPSAASKHYLSSLYVSLLSMSLLYIILAFLAPLDEYPRAVFSLLSLLFCLILCAPSLSSSFAFRLAHLVILFNLVLAFLALIGYILQLSGFTCQFTLYAQASSYDLAICLPFGQLSPIDHLAGGSYDFLLSRFRLYSWFTEPAVAAYSFTLSSFLFVLLGHPLLKRKILVRLSLSLFIVSIFLTQSTGCIVSLLLSCLVGSVFHLTRNTLPKYAFIFISALLSLLLISYPLIFSSRLSRSAALLGHLSFDNALIQSRIDSVINRIDILSSVTYFPFLYASPRPFSAESFFKGVSRSVSQSSIHKYLAVPGVISLPLLFLLVFPLVYAAALSANTLAIRVMFLFPVFMSLSYFVLFSPLTVVFCVCVFRFRDSGNAASFPFVRDAVA
jgi:hypothetical protein